MERVADGDLPMDSGAFYSNCLLPCRPEGVVVDIKKSSYKKLGKFLAVMEARVAGFL